LCVQFLVNGHVDWCRFYSQELLEDLEAVDEDAQLDLDGPDVDVVPEGPEDEEDVDLGDGVGEEDEEGVGGQDDDGDSRPVFLDAMSLGEDEDVSSDVLDLASREESSSISGVSITEEVTFDSDRCSIHSISNLLHRNVGAGANIRHNTVGDEDEDKGFGSPEGGMSHEASAASFSAMAGDSPTNSVDTPTADFEDAQEFVKESPSPSRKPHSDSDPNDFPPDKGDSAPSLHGAARPLYIPLGKARDRENGKMAADHDEVDASALPPRPKSESMKRSETEDLMSTLSLNSPTSAVNIRHIASDSVKWLATKLGPVLAARYLSRNLVRMLPLCYLGETQLLPIEEKGEPFLKT
jgi:hypothetical protein